MNTPDPAAPREFIEFWALRYAPSQDALYTANINCRHHTATTLAELFRWKIGAWLFSNSLKRTVKPHFLARIQQARELPPDISAADFLDVFQDGGAIYRIFWLHCWHPQRFPIYDQHVHRAMSFIQHGRVEELNECGDEAKIVKYIDTYIPFFKTFPLTGLAFDVNADGVRSRIVDRALFTFGKAIKLQ